MNGYKAFYKNKQTDVHAETSLSAQQIAATVFKTKNDMKFYVRKAIKKLLIMVMSFNYYQIKRKGEKHVRKF